MNVMLRICAGFIDLLQFIFFVVFLAFQVITPYGGAAVGGVSGAVICWKMSEGIVSGLVNGAACALGGGAAGGVVSALATPIGMAIDVAISSTFGVLLILLLWATGRFSMMAVIMGSATEMMPGINAFSPGWSLLVHRCIVKYDEKKRLGVSTQSTRMSVAIATRAAASVVAKGHGIVPALARSLPTPAEGSTPKEASRVPLQTKNFVDGIRQPNTSEGREAYA